MLSNVAKKKKISKIVENFKNCYLCWTIQSNEEGGNSKIEENIEDLIFVRRITSLTFIN